MLMLVELLVTIRGLVVFDLMSELVAAGRLLSQKTTVLLSVVAAAWQLRAAQVAFLLA
jgi:hypothetical protein